MKIIYLDCSMGAAGDMLTAALYELLDDGSKEDFLNKMNSLGLDGVSVSAEKTSKCGITGTHISVTVDGLEEDDHRHEHHHHHRSMHHISHIAEDLPLPDVVKADIKAVYNIIAEAESTVHGVPVSDIHFHEVGTLDAVADITGVCLLLDMLGADKIYASPVHVGSGSVKCAHGILPVPAPATAEILKGVPVYGGSVDGELCTPTGAALLKHFVCSFGDMPRMTVDAIGYGMGKKDFERANCVRAILGEASSEDGDTVVELVCNIDDMTAEDIGYAIEMLFDGGALDVYTVPVGMKNSRPGTMLCVLCAYDKKEDIVRLIFRHTSTIGVREYACPRHTLKREVKTVKTAYGDVRVKYSEGYGVSGIKPEYADIARIAKEKNVPIEAVRAAIDKEA